MPWRNPNIITQPVELFPLYKLHKETLIAVQLPSASFGHPTGKSNITTRLILWVLQVYLVQFWLGWLKPTFWLDINCIRYRCATIHHWILKPYLVQYICLIQNFNWLPFSLSISITNLCSSKLFHFTHCILSPIMFYTLLHHFSYYSIIHNIIFPTIQFLTQFPNIQDLFMDKKTPARMVNNQ